MTTERANNRMSEIRTEKPEWNEKQIAIQAIGEIIEENDSFIESFLLCESYDGNYTGILWVSEEIEYIPAKTLKILGNNGMNIKRKNYHKINQIEFF